MPIPILMYHQIDKPAGRGSPFRYLTVDPVNFHRQMNWLKRMGYMGLSIRDLQPYLKGEKIGKVFGITFDDGFRNVHVHALPVLDELGFTATNYFVSRQIGGFNEWDAVVGVPHSPCMSKAEMLEWAALGHEVGAHTLDHVHLTEIGIDEARRQITDVRHELEDMLGSTVDAFCYPYGNFSGDIRQLVESAGYTTATTTQRGRATSHSDMLLLPRKIVRRTDGWLNVLRKSVTG
ncbi:polysaccharide deacetylase family protein [Phyllobacterium myrsinacearum]|uniref:Chitooligosaccharide deacetylase n=1 Tax=Phyllobacterium myrsinacearum TaxID=28101 RepID=A0A839EBA1_9HYPH|nr:polysaccharide deacetylase family protein [Phyllobacterium myrsinacearum]MBA8877161.1 peptidoglycan/xylan/chitin deacetylase (PgdA/CDA1 family) [Phyllobacterium myrsinacearum]